MKSKHLSLLLLLIILFSCGSNNSFIAGKWTIDGVGSADSSNTKDKFFVYGMLTMISSGSEFNFDKNGKFNLSNQGKEIASGNYSISSNGKTLSLKADSGEYVYEITKSDEKEIMLKSTKDASIIKMKK